MSACMCIRMCMQVCMHGCMHECRYIYKCVGVYAEICSSIFFVHLKYFRK